jgi:membrane-associated protease RseP (regulator of RpoE activity)
VVEYLNSLSLGEILFTIVGSLLTIPALVLIHELGHALTAVALGHRVRELRVGNDEAVVTMRWRAFVLRLGPQTAERRFAGYVIYDGTRARAWHVLLIALAGPLASLAGAFAAACALIAIDSHPVVLMLAVVGGLQVGTANLSSNASDGRQVRLAWQALRAPVPPPRWADPNVATSVAPPGY